MNLPKPARYFPIEKGLYEVAAGLRVFGTDFGNGALDSQVIQLDQSFDLFRASKLECRRERIGKYHLVDRYPPDTARATHLFLIERLIAEHPTHFKKNIASNSELHLECKLTSERLRFSNEGDYLGVNGFKASNGPTYISGMDALACQFQEDIAVVQRGQGDEDWLAAIHLCSPSHWSAGDKIGKNFFAIHTPVPGIDRVNKASASLVDAMISKGPYVRFVWGFSTDRRLNHHPEPPQGIALEEWKGRKFETGRPGSPFILRVERQVTWGISQAEAGLFFIRVSFIDGDEIRRNEEERKLLHSALVSMTQESRVYKGLGQCMDEVLDWLKEFSK